MTKLRTGDPWMPTPEYGRSLRGLTINLLVAEIEASLEFHTEVLAARIVYSDPDIAVLRNPDAEWMLHAWHTYDNHPLYASVTASVAKGVGVELRVHGRDPDQAERAARRLGYDVVAAAADKPHGLREAVIRDRDGYYWVPDVPSAGNP